MNELRFDGRVAVVTGAGRGIGRCHALLLASRGASVVVADIGCDMDGSGSSPGPVQEVVDEIKGNSGQAVACFASVADQTGAKSIVETALATFGGLDVVVNNAGIRDPALFESLSIEQFHRMIDVHYYGTLYVTKAAWPHLRAARYGRIVNTISGAILGGLPEGTSYAAAKGAIFAFTRKLAVEAAGLGIHVNAVAPAGNTRGYQAGLDRLEEAFGDPELVEAMTSAMRPELASPAVAFLAHESCPLNGEVLVTAGGSVSRLAMIETAGISRKSITAEDIAENLETIMDTTDAALKDISIGGDSAPVAVRRQ